MALPPGCPVGSVAGFATVLDACGPGRAKLGTPASPLKTWALLLRAPTPVMFQPSHRFQRAHEESVPHESAGVAGAMMVPVPTERFVAKPIRTRPLFGSDQREICQYG